MAGRVRGREACKGRHGAGWRGVPAERSGGPAWWSGWLAEWTSTQGRRGGPVGRTRATRDTIFKKKNSKFDIDKTVLFGDKLVCH